MRYRDPFPFRGRGVEPVGETLGIFKKDLNSATSRSRELEKQVTEKCDKSGSTLQISSPAEKAMTRIILRVVQRFIFSLISRAEKMHVDLDFGMMREKKLGNKE